MGWGLVPTATGCDFLSKIRFCRLGVDIVFTSVTRTTTTRTTPHQNLPEGDVLKGLNLTHRLLMGFWLCLGG